MTNKEKYINYTNNVFNGKAKEIITNQINLFYNDEISINKNHYNIDDNVFLKKGTFIHGIFGELENFDFTSEPRPNKICNSVGMWNIQNDMLVKRIYKSI